MSVLRARGVVTPEAVRLEFQPAGVGSRALALLLDLLALSAIMFTVGMAMFLARAWMSPVTVGSIAGLVLLAYPVAFEVGMRGRTPGKAALGLRVVTVEGAPVQVRHATIRAAFGLLDVYATFGAVAVASTLLTVRNQRLGDLVAGTMVLRERTGESQPLPVHFEVPRGWEAYAAMLDPAVLDAETYATVRAFLIRAHGFDPAARERLARRLATPLAERLGHRPPQRVSPELFLLCLASRYQSRTGRLATR